MLNLVSQAFTAHPVYSIRFQRVNCSVVHVERPPSKQRMPHTANNLNTQTKTKTYHKQRAGPTRAFPSDALTLGMRGATPVIHP